MQKQEFAATHPSNANNHQVHVLKGIVRKKQEHAPFPPFVQTIFAIHMDARLLMEVQYVPINQVGGATIVFPARMIVAMCFPKILTAHTILFAISAQTQLLPVMTMV
jgi:hypothetical protein